MVASLDTLMKTFSSGKSHNPRTQSLWPKVNLCEFQETKEWNCLPLSVLMRFPSLFQKHTDLSADAVTIFKSCSWITDHTAAVWPLIVERAVWFFESLSKTQYLAVVSQDPLIKELGADPLDKQLTENFLGNFKNFTKRMINTSIAVLFNRTGRKMFWRFIYQNNAIISTSYN